MSSDRSLTRWLSERRRQALIAVMGIGLAVFVYLLADGKTNLGSLIQGLALSVIFAAGAYLFANYFLYSDELEPNNVFRRIGEIVEDRGLRDVASAAPAVDWPGLLNGPPTMSVEGFVRYLDRPVDDYYESFVTFFERGGSLTLILPAEDEKIGAEIAAQFDPGNPIQPKRVLERIANTRDGLERAIADAAARDKGSGPPGRLEIIEATRAPNFWALVLDGRRALFAPYDNWAKSGSRAPVFDFDLTVATGLAECLNHEIAQFRQAARA